MKKISWKGFRLFKRKNFLDSLDSKKESVWNWKPKPEYYTKKTSGVFYIVLALVLLLSQIATISRAAEQDTISKSTTADWDKGTNANVNTDSNEVKLAANNKNGWYLTGGTWSYRQKVTIDHEKVANTSQYEFPVLIKNTDEDNPVFANAKDDGYDILFTADDEGTKLSHEIESFSKTNHELIAWVKIPNLSTSADTIIYMYYGNASAEDQQDVANVWSNGYLQISHLEDATSTTTADSTGHGWTGTKTDPNPTETDGKFGKGQNFTGGHFNFSGPSSTGAAALTTSGWVKSSGWADSMTLWTSGQFVRTTDTSHLLFSIYKQGTGWIERQTSNVMNDTSWHYVVQVWDGATGSNQAIVDNNVILNANEDAGTLGDNGYASSLGWFYWTPFAGDIDEYRISSVARSADWITTEYNNQNDPESFASFDSEVAKTSLKITTDGIAALWYSTDWKHRRKITVDNAKVPNTNQADFPVLVKITDTSDPVFGADTKDDGTDIVFSSPSGTKYSHELEKYSKTTHELIAWVKIPVLYTSADTIYYMYYGNAGTDDQQNKTDVWSNGYAGVWHMNGSPMSALDSTSNANNGTNVGASATEGKVDGAGSFNGSGNRMTVADAASLDFTSQTSFETWIYPTGYLASGVARIEQRDGGRFELAMGTTAGSGGIPEGNLGFATSQISWTDTGYHFDLNNWYKISMNFNGSVWKAYVNGSLVYTSGASTITISSNMGIGAVSYDGSEPFSGTIDDPRISSVARSADWVKTEYDNQNDPASFETIASEQNYYSAESWHLDGWLYRQQIIIDHTKVPNTDQTDFPVLVKISDQNNPVFTRAQSTGYDILFTSSNGTTKLSHEIEKFATDAGSKELDAWVKVTTLSHTEDTVLYMYYGNATADDQQNKTDVWSNDFSMVQHFGEASWSGAEGEVVDATGNGNNGKSSGGAQNDGVGIAGKGAGILTGSEAVTFTKSNWNITEPNTTTFWIKPTAWVDWGFLFFDYNSYALRWTGSQFHGWRTGGRASNTISPPSAGEYHYLALEWTGSATNFYLDGENIGSPAGPDSLLDFSGFYIDAPDFAGVFDEYRIDSTARSADWIKTEYNNQSAPATFYSISGESSSSYYSSPTSTDAGSEIIDTNWNGGWGSPNGFSAVVTVPDTTSIAFSARTSAVGGSSDGDWTSWQSLGSATSTGTFTVAHDDMPAGLTAGTNHYMQVKASLISPDGLYSTGTPVMESYTVYYLKDIDPPTNPNTVSATLDGSPLTTQTWTNTTGEVTFSFSGATDPESGVAGYYTYFGTSATGDPSDYQAHVGGQSDTQTLKKTIASGNYYYFRIKSKDVAGNISSASTLFEVGCDTSSPDKPSQITVDPAGYTTENSFDFSWPEVTTSVSGIKWYEYKRSTDAAWSHTADSSVKSVNDILAYQEGANTFYVRSVNNAGTASSSYVQVTYYWSGEAPPRPDNVAVTPGSATENDFTITWDKPAQGPGDSPIVGYRYSINTPPTISNTTYIASTAAHVSVGPDHFATRQGENTVYVVSQNEAGKNSFLPAYYSTATFTCQTTAPPTPVSVGAYDSSDKVYSRWMLTIQWQAGSGQDPTTFDHYAIERSTNGTNFSSLANVSSATTYVDSSNLSDQTTYYYRIKAVDNAGSTSAVSTTVSAKPTGKYLTPPTIISEVQASIKSSEATIKWSTNRPSTSYVRYGTSENDLRESKGTFETAVNHEVTINGLTGATRYYYQVQSADENRDYPLSQAYSSTYSLVTLASPAVSNVDVANITLDSADISWETTTVSSSQILYGGTASYGKTLEDTSSNSTTKHQVKIADLNNSSTYHFKITATDENGNGLVSDDYSFETLPLPKIETVNIEQIKDKAEQTVKIKWTSNVATSSIVRYSAVGEKEKEVAKAKLETEHEQEIVGLSDSTKYTFFAEGRDQFGNLATSAAVTYQTQNDSRAPKLSDVTSETSNVGYGEKDKAQMAVSWKSDEPSTSLVEYGKGLSGDLTQKTVEDKTLTTDHLVIISELEPNQPYRFKADSADKAGNIAKTDETVVVVGDVQKSVLSIILQSIRNAFGWISIKT